MIFDFKFSRKRKELAKKAPKPMDFTVRILLYKSFDYL